MLRNIYNFSLLKRNTISKVYSEVKVNKKTTFLTLLHINKYKYFLFFFSKWYSSYFFNWSKEGSWGGSVLCNLIRVSVSQRMFLGSRSQPWSCYSPHTTLRNLFFFQIKQVDLHLFMKNFNIKIYLMDCIYFSSNITATSKRFN